MKPTPVKRVGTGRMRRGSTVVTGDVLERTDNPRARRVFVPRRISPRITSKYDPREENRKRAVRAGRLTPLPRDIDDWFERLATEFLDLPALAGIGRREP